ncbi:MAG: murein L,D-transpeptidase family protein [Thermosynechococcaceae cyanobacterium]
MNRTIQLGILALASSVALYALSSRLGYTMPISSIPSLLCVGGCPDSQSMHQPSATEGLLNGDKTIASVLETETPNKQNISILIEKAKYRLTVYYDRKPIKSYPMVLGSAPTGDKLREGDRKTPEGIFKIRDLYPHESWSKFLWLDYPTEVSWRKHLEAKRSGKLDLSATIGGEVGIHGVPEGNDGWIDTRQNWTWGCPSLKNKDIDELYSVVQVGTVVEILP